MKKTKYDDYKKASTYLCNEYKMLGIESISIGKIRTIKENLIKHHSTGGLMSIKSSITAQLEQYKQANIFMPALVFLFTIIFTLRYYSYTAKREYEQLLDEMMGIDESDTKYAAVTAIDSFLTANFAILVLITLLMGLAFYVYFKRYVWISLMKNIVDDALEERKRLDKEDE